jgi:hypothetical protein
VKSLLVSNIVNEVADLVKLFNVVKPAAVELQAVNEETTFDFIEPGDGGVADHIEDSPIVSIDVGNDGDMVSIPGSQRTNASSDSETPDLSHTQTPRNHPQAYIPDTYYDDDFNCYEHEDNVSTEVRATTKSLAADVTNDSESDPDEPTDDYILALRSQRQSQDAYYSSQEGGTKNKYHDNEVIAGTECVSYEFNDNDNMEEEEGHDENDCVQDIELGETAVVETIEASQVVSSTGTRSNLMHQRCGDIISRIMDSITSIEANLAGVKRSLGHVS